MPARKRLSREESLNARKALMEAAGKGELSWSEGVKAIRRSLGLSQEDFARLFKLTRRQVWELESGNANPTVETLMRLGKPLGLTVGFVPRTLEESAPETTDLRREHRRIGPTGGYYDHLVGLAREERVREMAESFGHYAAILPDDQGIVASQVPAILVNHFAPLMTASGGSLARFHAWTKAHPGWAGEVSDAIRDPDRFVGTVDLIVKSVANS